MSISCVSAVRSYPTKPKSSGNGPWIGVSKYFLGPGWMVTSPSEAKKVAICSWFPSLKPVPKPRQLLFVHWMLAD
jgi:hypothetical protein